MTNVSLPQAIIYCWGLNLLEIVVGFLCLQAAQSLGTAVALGVVLIGGVGVVQLVYVIPFYLTWKRQGNADAIKGLIIAASVTALLNATCWGFAWR